MTIRLAGSADLPAVEALTQRAYAHYEAELGGQPIPVTEDYAPRIAAGEVWLLELDGEAAGLIVLEMRPHDVHIFSVAVAPEHQHSGLGRTLLAFAERTALANGLAAVDLCTHEKMARNIAIYRRGDSRNTAAAPIPGARAGFWST